MHSKCKCPSIIWLQLPHATIETSITMQTKDFRNWSPDFGSHRPSFGEKATRYRSTDNDPQTGWDKPHYITTGESF